MGLVESKHATFTEYRPKKCLCLDPSVYSLRTTSEMSLALAARLIYSWNWIRYHGNYNSDKNSFELEGILLCPALSWRLKLSSVIQPGCIY